MNETNNRTYCKQLLRPKKGGGDAARERNFVFFFVEVGDGAPPVSHRHQRRSS